MGLFDTVKEKANALAADAERAGKVTAAQARTVVLQNDIRKAERELGHATFLLVESGELAHPDLEPMTTRLRDARRALQDKEAEITALRGQTDAETVERAAAQGPSRRRPPRRSSRPQPPARRPRQQGSRPRGRLPRTPPPRRPPPGRRPARPSSRPRPFPRERFATGSSPSSRVRAVW